MRTQEIQDAPTSPQYPAVLPVGVDMARQYFLTAIHREACQMAESNDAASVAMAGITRLAQGFAAAMRETSMPVDRVYRDTFDDSQPERVIGRTEQPYWMVVAGTALDGTELSWACAGYETCSYSLGSGTPNNFKTVMHDVNTSDIEVVLSSRRIKGKRLKAFQYDEDAIGVTPGGVLILLRKAVYATSHSEDIPRSPSALPYYMSNQDVTPENMFDITKKIKPEAILSAMTARLEASRKTYQLVLQQETQAGPVLRAPDYYEPITTRIEIPEDKKPSLLNRLFGC